MKRVEITVTDIPKCIKTLVFSPKTILSERTTVEYLDRMKEYIFGSECVEAAETISIDLFDLVFINDKAFDECCEYYLNKVRDRDKAVIKTAFLLKKMYNNDYIRIANIRCSSGKAYIKEPEYAYLNLLNEDLKPKKKEKKAQNNEYSKRARLVLDAVRLAAVKYGMQNTIQYKELIDKYNIRRFSTNLKLNNRPATVEQINAVLEKNKDKCIADLCDEKTRIRFSALFAIAYGGYKLSDLYSNNTVFDITSFDKEKRLSDLAGDLINIVNNGNGIEIANTFIHIITGFAKTELPKVDMKDLGSVMDNYSMYYAAATLASVCEGIFRYEGLNGEFRQYLKKHTINNYWTSMERLMLMKQYSVIVSFCYKLAHFDPVLYLEDPEYQGEILYAFENAEKFAKELKKSVQV